MMSPNLKFEQFLAGLGTRSYHETILLAEKEILDAWRASKKTPPCHGKGKDNGCQMYQEKIEKLIQFVRYGAKPLGLSPEERTLLDRLGNSVH